MNVPGSNLLRLAMGPIARQTLQHHAFTGSVINSVGDEVSTFATPVDITGSFQAVNRQLYQVLGLNLAKDYSMLYTQANVMPTERDREGDLVEFGGDFWQCSSDQDWRAVDGWRKLLCVKVPAP